MTITPVLLAGGSGTRLWPLSRKAFPKQFAPLVGEESLFQASARRLSGPGFGAPIVVTGEDFRFVVREQLAALGITPAAVIIEPSPRNTAPAVAVAALMAADTTPEGLILIAPSDHVIPDADAFRSAVEAATERANAGDIVTFGITPDRPETGYGYLEVAPEADPHATTPQPLAAFVEKPDADRAAEMLTQGRFLWNAGIFLSTAETMIAAFEAQDSKTLAACREALATAGADLGFTRLSPAAWEATRAQSIDYAIMEKIRNLAVMPYAGHWSDLGGWEALWQEAGPDAAGNVTDGAAHALDCTNTLLRSSGAGQPLVGIGLDDIVAVSTPDAVLVMRKSASQRAGEAVAHLRRVEAPQADHFPRDHRPWGHFESLARGPRFQVKRIVVKPGASLSLQSHHHRAEHWIVVAGTARVTISDNVQLLAENESVYVPLGAVHRLENPGKVDVVLIEVQTGTYLGEDDIQRYEDVYRRS